MNCPAGPEWISKVSGWIAEQAIYEIERFSPWGRVVDVSHPVVPQMRNRSHRGRRVSHVLVNVV